MIDFEILKQQNNLVTDGDRIYVKPINNYNYETYPLKDLGGALALTLDEYLGLRANYYMFNDTLTGLVLYENSIVDEPIIEE